MIDLHLTRDLVPDTPHSKLLIAITVAAFTFSSEKLLAVAIIWGVNLIITVWLVWTYADNGAYLPVVMARIQHLGIYVLAIILVGALSVLLPEVGAEWARTFLYGSIGGIEVAVGLGMLARLSERFRYIYKGIVQKIDDLAPIPIESEYVKGIIDKKIDRDAET